MVSRADGCSELNGSSHQSEVQLLVGSGLLECEPMFVPNRSRPDAGPHAMRELR